MESVGRETLIAEGKTKKIWKTETEYQVIVESKDDLTAGDGARHDVVPGKAALATHTTSNVFRLLVSCGLPVAFLKEVGETRFLAEYCDMIPYEVVVRREAHGSFLKRYPALPKGHIFPKLIIEFFLKTSSRKWQGNILPKDDPLIRFIGEHAFLYVPDQPIHRQVPFLTLEDFPLRESPQSFEEIGNIAIKAFLVLEKAWHLVGRRLVDFKIELGINARGLMKIADVIDNDSWRVLENGCYIDKQLYRNGVDLGTVLEKYRLVAELTKNFHIPRQQIIIWRASPNDDFKPFEDALKAYGAREACQVVFVTCSIHKEPIRAFEEIIRLVEEIPDSVVIVYVGRSNGAGPTLSAQVPVPVISVPATWKEFPEDIWSSLRMPSDTPALTILDPKNAVLAALQILAMRNPHIYAEIRARQEERLCNIMRI